MIDIRKTKSGEARYRVRRWVNGRKIHRSFKRKHDAIQFERSIDLGVEVDKAQINFRVACEEWLANHGNLKKALSSVRADRDMLKNHLYPLFTRRKLAEIEPGDIDQLIQTLKAKGLKNTTINRNLQLLRAIFYYYMKRRVLTFNPIFAVGLLKAEPIEQKFWNTEEVANFLEHARNKYAESANHSIYLLYKVAVNTGMRLGELIGLQWSDVDLSSGLIVVSRTYCNISRCVKPTTKSNKIRHIPISDAIRSDLAQAKIGKTPTDPVFVRDGKRIDPDNFRHRNFETDVAASGVQRIRFHDLRHTFASHFMMNGGALYDLQAILGHSSSDVTQRYAHLSKAFLIGKRNIVSFGDRSNVIAIDFTQKHVQ